MPNERARTSGFLLAELIVSLTLLGLIFAGLGVSLAGFARFNGVQWGRQQCLAAAQAQLDSLTATGRALSEAEIERLWPDVTVTMERSPGQGQWAGLELVQVTASIDATRSRAAVHLARYVRPTVPPAEGGSQL